MSDIVILDSDEFSRCALSGLLRRAGLSDACDIRATLGQAGGAPLYLNVGSLPDEGVIEIRENDHFPRPLRIGALLDRIHWHVSQRADRSSFENNVIGPYTLDFVSSALVHNETGEEVRLTDKEKHILMCLLGKRGDVVERSVLLDEVWGYVEGVETHTLETHIYRLRQKIEKDPAFPELLMTVENGYKLTVL